MFKKLLKGNGIFIEKASVIAEILEGAVLVAIVMFTYVLFVGDGLKSSVKITSIQYVPTFEFVVPSIVTFTAF